MTLIKGEGNMRKGKVFLKNEGGFGLSYDNLGEEQRIFCLFSYIEKRIRERGGVYGEGIG